MGFSGKMRSEPETISPSSLLQAAHTAILEMENEESVEAHKFLIPSTSSGVILMPQSQDTQAKEGSECINATAPEAEEKAEPLKVRNEELVDRHLGPMKLKRVDVPLRKVHVKGTEDMVVIEEKIVMKCGNGQNPRFEAQDEVREDVAAAAKTPEQAAPTVKERKPREYIIPADEPEEQDSETEQDEADNFSLRLTLHNSTHPPRTKTS